MFPGEGDGAPRLFVNGLRLRAYVMLFSVRLNVRRYSGFLPGVVEACESVLGFFVFRLVNFCPGVWWWFACPSGWSDLGQVRSSRVCPFFRLERGIGWPYAVLVCPFFFRRGRVGRVYAPSLRCLVVDWWVLEVVYYCGFSDGFRVASVVDVAVIED